MRLIVVELVHRLSVHLKWTRFDQKAESYHCNIFLHGFIKCEFVFSGQRFGTIYSNQNNATSVVAITPTCSSLLPPPFRHSHSQVLHHRSPED